MNPASYQPNLLKALGIRTWPLIDHLINWAQRQFRFGIITMLVSLVACLPDSASDSKKIPKTRIDILNETTEREWIIAPRPINVLALAFLKQKQTSTNHHTAEDNNKKIR